MCLMYNIHICVLCTHGCIILGSRLGPLVVANFHNFTCVYMSNRYLHICMYMCIYRGSRILWESVCLKVWLSALKAKDVDKAAMISEIRYGCKFYLLLCVQIQICIDVEETLVRLMGQVMEQKPWFGFLHSLFA